MKKTLLFLLAIYAIAPLFAGILNYWNPRGPKIYYGEYHFCLQRLGARFAGHVKPYDSLFERPWFYGGAKVRWTPKTRPLRAGGDHGEKDNPPDSE